MRHLREILMEQETKVTELGKDGTYIAVHFSDKTNSDLTALAKALKVDNIVSEKKMHCTIVYSRKPFKDFTVHGKLKTPWEGTPTKLEIFETQTGSRALVLRFDCKEMKDRHEYFKKEYGATYDYDEYKIHSTLSYDVGKDWEIPKDFDIKKYVDTIEVSEEYYQPLDNEWAKKATDTADKDKK